ncbi:hypothetical protein HK102_003419, partial [Quaeritorhiza haematococci]
ESRRPLADLPLNTSAIVGTLKTNNPSSSSLTSVFRTPPRLGSGSENQTSNNDGTTTSTAWHHSEYWCKQLAQSTPARLDASGKACSLFAASSSDTVAGQQLLEHTQASRWGSIPTRCLVLENVPDSMSNEELETVFRKFGDIKRMFRIDRFENGPTQPPLPTLPYNPRRQLQGVGIMFYDLNDAFRAHRAIRTNPTIQLDLEANVGRGKNEGERSVRLVGYFGDHSLMQHLAKNQRECRAEVRAGETDVADDEEEKNMGVLLVSGFDAGEGARTDARCSPPVVDMVDADAAAPAGRENSDPPDFREDDKLMELLRKFGTIHSFREYFEIASAEDNVPEKKTTFRHLVEYHDIRCAKVAKMFLDGGVFGNTLLKLTYHDPAKSGWDDSSVLQQQSSTGSTITIASDTKTENTADAGECQDDAEGSMVIQLDDEDLAYVSGDTSVQGLKNQLRILTNDLRPSWSPWDDQGMASSNDGKQHQLSQCGGFPSAGVVPINPVLRRLQEDLGRPLSAPPAISEHSSTSDEENLGEGFYTLFGAPDKGLPTTPFTDGGDNTLLAMDYFSRSRSGSRETRASMTPVSTPSLLGDVATPASGASGPFGSTSAFLSSAPSSACPSTSAVSSRASSPTLSHLSPTLSAWSSRSGSVPHPIRNADMPRLVAVMTAAERDEQERQSEVHYEEPLLQHPRPASVPISANDPLLFNSSLPDSSFVAMAKRCIAAERDRLERVIQGGLTCASAPPTTSTTQDTDSNDSSSECTKDYASRLKHTHDAQNAEVHVNSETAEDDKSEGWAYPNNSRHPRNRQRYPGAPRFPGQGHGPTTSGVPAGNQLNLYNIAMGLDKRTTFMIRNIPNKYSQQMLMDYIDETCRRQYDFLYLRMDFVNKCNVGYAFINFISPEAILVFADKVVGKKWAKFNSEKVCTLSYANVQGRDALIEKFRNSSVMLEQPSYRPKIFFTSGPNKGQEEPFPLPTMPIRPRSNVLFTRENAAFQRHQDPYVDRDNENRTDGRRYVSQKPQPYQRSGGGRQPFQQRRFNDAGGDPMQDPKGNTSSNYQKDVATGDGRLGGTGNNANPSVAFDGVNQNNGEQYLGISDTNNSNRSFSSLNPPAWNGNGDDYAVFEQQQGVYHRHQQQHGAANVHPNRQRDLRRRMLLDHDFARELERKGRYLERGRRGTPPMGHNRIHVNPQYYQRMLRAGSVSYGNVDARTLVPWSELLLSAVDGPLGGTPNFENSIHNTYDEAYFYALAAAAAASSKTVLMDDDIHSGTWPLSNVGNSMQHQHHQHPHHQHHQHHHQHREPHPQHVPLQPQTSLSPFLPDHSSLWAMGNPTSSTTPSGVSTPTNLTPGSNFSGDSYFGRGAVGAEGPWGAPPLDDTVNEDDATAAMRRQYSGMTVSGNSQTGSRRMHSHSSAASSSASSLSAANSSTFGDYPGHGDGSGGAGSGAGGGHVWDFQQEAATKWPNFVLQPNAPEFKLEN